MSEVQYQACIEACHACVLACENCAAACLEEEDLEMVVGCIELDRSCADICALAAREMARNSDFAMRLCAICAEVCEACGTECAKHKMDHCQRCAEACRRCAQLCLAMVQRGPRQPP